MNQNRSPWIALAAMSLLMAIAGCSDRNPTGLEIARAPIDPLVFEDALSEDVYFQPFFQTHYTTMELDSVFAFDGFAHDGARSLKMTIPPLGSALGPFSGGVLTSSGNRDLADFNALTFYARADSNISLNVAGFGNDNTGTSLYEAIRVDIPLTREWTFVVVPVPDPSRLIAERGLFSFAEGVEDQYPLGYAVWFDEIRFAKLGNIEVFRPTMDSGPQQYFVGSTVAVTGTYTVFRLDGAFTFVYHSAGYFDYASSDPAVAAVTGSEIEVIGSGESIISGKLQDVDVFGTINLAAYEPPTVAATPPTLPAASVISMFSDVYSDVPVDTWNTQWGGSNAQVENYVVAGDNTLMYTNLNFVGIEFRNPTIDASAMSHFHLDVYAPAGTDFKVKLVSFPDGGDASVETMDLVLTADTTPAFVAGGWSALEIPLTDFQLPEGWDWAHIGQMVLSTSNAQLVLVDNVYWHE